MTEEERQERLLLLLLAIARSSERRIQAKLRPTFLRSMRRLRRLVQKLPEEGIMRQFQWTQIQAQSLPIFETTSRTYRNYLLREIQSTIPDVQDAAFDYSGDDTEGLNAELIPRTQEDLLTTIRGSMNRNQSIATLAALFGRNEGFSRFTLQSAKALNRTVGGQILMDVPTQQIADKVVKLIQQRGTVAAVIHTGSFANLEWNRYSNVSAAAVWDATTKELLKTWQDTPQRYWVWNALLEACPVCKPLDGMRRDSVSQFPYIPPVHPNCRCAVLPVLG